jgi:hypothetical protein
VLGLAADQFVDFLETAAHAGNHRASLLEGLARLTDSARATRAAWHLDALLRVVTPQIFADVESRECGFSDELSPSSI